MFCDYHVHTIYSDDSTYPMEDVVKDAIAMGLKEICFSDHVDYGIKVDYTLENEGQCEKLWNVDYEKYFSEIKALQHKYKKQITIKRGLEFGVQTHTIPAFEALYRKYPMDFIILSIHQINDKEFWTNEFQQGHSEAEYYAAYYQEMYDVVQNYHHYSVLGHMDMLKRYDTKDGYDAFHEHEAIITDILTYIIADGKGIELNTSSIPYGLHDLMPSKDILKLYLKLGGQILTIGSDSHKKEHLGGNIERLKKELKAIGFKQFCTFEAMIPVFHEL